MNLLRLQCEGPMARIVIDHPQRRNAFTRAMWRALPGLVQQAGADRATRVLVLQASQPGVFAAGADISEFEATYRDAAEAERASREINDAVDALQACPLPVVALIDGPCVGGGVALAVACDIRLASDRARFAVTPARLGLSYHPDDLRRLVRACGLAAASELLYGGQIWDAERALRAGLANQVLPQGEAFDAGAQALLQAICGNSVDATRAIKQGLNAVTSHEPQALEAAARHFVQLFQGRDFAEGRDAFLAKRPARFPSHQDRTDDD